MEATQIPARQHTRSQWPPTGTTRVSGRVAYQFFSRYDTYQMDRIEPSVVSRYNTKIPYQEASQIRYFSVQHVSESVTIQKS